MRLFINAISIEKGGAEQVALSVIHECRAFPENEYHIALRDNISSQILEKEYPENFLFHHFSERPGEGVQQYRRVIRQLNNLENRVKPDCVISTGGHGYWKPKNTPVMGGFNIPHYIYPESPYFKKLSIRKQIYWFVMKRIHMSFYRQLDSIFVQTDDVKLRLKNLLSDNQSIHTVPNTINQYFLHGSVSSKSKLPPAGNVEVRLLTLSSYYQHKNHEFIAKVASYLKEKGETRFKFVVTLPDSIYQSLFYECKDMVVNVGKVAASECPALYRECDFMFLPTLLECFSASYAEAMAMNKPIITSDLGFAHAVCGDAAEYIDPTNPKQAGDCIVSLAADTHRQQQLIERGQKKMSGFGSARKRAEELLRLCNEISAN